jgi:CarD family transcriptional regulator
MATASLSISIGDRVVYPNQGLCKVTGIETKEVAGQKLSFVTLQREEDGAKVMVPEAKVTAIGVRKVAGAEDVGKIFSFLKSDSDKASLDWKARARTNVERMSAGGLMGLAEVVKGLQVLSELRPLPTKERGLYNDARHLLVTELSAALGVPGCDAEDALDAVLFPPGKDRPRRTAEEFKALAGGDDELGIGEDLLGLDGEAGLEEGQEEGEEKAEGESGDETASGEAEGDEAPKKGKAAKAPKAGKPGKAPKAEAAPKKSVVSDFEATEPLAAPIDPSLPVPKKRGRPPKPKPPPEGAAPVAAPVAAPLAPLAPQPKTPRAEISHFAAKPAPKEVSKANAAALPLAALAHKAEPKPEPKAAKPAAKAKPAVKAAAAKKPAAKPAAKKKK